MSHEDRDTTHQVVLSVIHVWQARSGSVVVVKLQHSPLAQNPLSVAAAALSQSSTALCRQAMTSLGSVHNSAALVSSAISRRQGSDAELATFKVMTH